MLPRCVFAAVARFRLLLTAPSSQVPLYGVLLFGGKVNVELEKGVTVGTDGWVMMRAWPRIGVLVNSLRRLFDADLEANFESPNFGGEILLVVTLILAHSFSLQVTRALLYKLCWLS